MGRENAVVGATEHVWRDLDSPRAPTEHEQRLLISLASAVPEPRLRSQVSSVVIDAVCRCGCASVRLQSDQAAIPPRRVAELSGRHRPDYFTVEAVGQGPHHAGVNVVLHVWRGRVAELEIFDSVKGEGAVELGRLSSVNTPSIN